MIILFLKAKQNSDKELKNGGYMGHAARHQQTTPFLAGKQAWATDYHEDKS